MSLPRAYDGVIHPHTLQSQVKSTAAYLYDVPQPLLHDLLDGAAHPRGFLSILHSIDAFVAAEPSPNDDLAGYFAICLAAHHATVATFVPTDVDSKIRGLLWRQARDRDLRRRLFHFSLAAMNWTLDGISRRATELSGVGPVSGHNGEQLSVLAGALGAFLRDDDTEYVELAAQAIDRELLREAHEFRYAWKRPGCELDTLRLAASLTHNVGDLDQGISFWPKSEPYRELRERFSRLAHENLAAYDGTYQIAAAIYRAAMSCEGHRHYPLRQVKGLRRSPDLLLPLGPFLDDWGIAVATHPSLTDEDRTDTLASLLNGSRKLPGQRGYYRAIAGMSHALGGSFDRLAAQMPSSARADWKAAATRKEVAVPRASFESMMKKMLAAAA